MEAGDVTEELLAVLETGTAEERRQAATGPLVTEAVLMRALGCEDVAVRMVAAGNAAASEAVLMRAVGDEE